MVYIVRVNMTLSSRETELSKVYRYEWSPCTPMYYRPNLSIHTRRVEWMATEIANYLLETTNAKINIDLLKEMARFHDDTEIITWDYLAMDKESFNEDKQSEYENDSIKAIDILYKNFWNISENFDYKDLLLSLEDKKGIEFLIVDMADKLDAHLEITHELFAWNEMFAIILTKWWLDVGPFDYTKNKVKKIVSDILELCWQIKVDNTFLDMNWDYDDVKCLQDSRVHSVASIKEKTWYNLYDKWIDLHFKYWWDFELNYLVNQLEFKN